MGINCNIIITFENSYGDDSQRLAINQYLGMPDANRTFIHPIGGRAWEPTDLDTIVVCVKSWHEEECQEFFKFLRSLHWPEQTSVQIYYAAASLYPVEFTYFKLFQNVTLTDPRLKEAPDQLTLRCQQLYELDRSIPPVQGLQAGHEPEIS
jgi:hypothetical protein